MWKPIEEGTIREAHAWYMDGPSRTLAQAATQYGLNRETLRKKAKGLGLKGKPRGPVHGKALGRRAQCTAYAGILADYRSGMPVEKISICRGLRADAIVKVLRDEGEACYRCDVLLRKTEPEGVAVLVTGEYMCQSCAEETRASVMRWARLPIGIVQDCYELLNVYAWQGER